MIFYYKRQFINFFQIFAAFLLLTIPAAPAQEPLRPAPETATSIIEKQSVTAKSYMAVTAHPLATKTAEKILAGGGTAADAGIAAQLILGLVEPQSSGLGGGAFALYYEADSGTLHSWDARETAPELAWPEMFYNRNGEPMEFDEAVIGGRSVGVPGTPALLHKLYKEYGRAPVDTIFNPAIRLAEEGFIISPRLAALIEKDRGKLDRYEAARSYFYHDDGSAKQAGDHLRNPAYAQVLKQFSIRGLSWFYEDLAPAIVKTVHHAGGYLSEEDFAAYDVKARPPVCGFYRAYKICAMGEPSSGGLTLIQILGLLEPFDLGGGLTARNVHLVAEASRLAFADRNKYMADPDFVDTPGAALIGPAYLAERSMLIDPDKRQDEVQAGLSDPEKGTSHITIADSYGNILSMTTTIEGAFGSKLMTRGFLLNNELTDFNFKTGTANSVEPGKRPRSSMAPAIIFDPQGRPFMAIGSAGGSRIIGFVAQRIIAVIDWDMELQDALDMPHVLARSDTIELETGLEDIRPELEKRGHTVRVDNMNSGLTAILFRNGLMTGAADKRREGIAAGY